MNRKFKKQHLFEIENVTFDQFNAALNESYFPHE